MMLINNKITEPKPPNRFKIILFEIIGNIAHTMFGVATDQSVNDAKRVVMQTRQEKRKWHIASMTVLNHTHGKMDEERKQMNGIRHYLNTAVTFQFQQLQNYTMEN